MAHNASCTDPECRGDCLPAPEHVEAETTEFHRTLPCPHGRVSWEMCPHCNGVNSIEPQQFHRLEPMPGIAPVPRWEVYRCASAEPDQACGIREVESDLVARMVVSDTARDLCQHHMRLADAQEICQSHNARASAYRAFQRQARIEQVTEDQVQAAVRAIDNVSGMPTRVLIPPPNVQRAIDAGLDVEVQLPEYKAEAEYRTVTEFVPTHVGITEHGPELGGVLKVKGDVPPDQFREFREKFMREANAIRPLIVDSEDVRDWRQQTVGRWAVAAFGREEATSVPQRSLRLLEEAVEMAQACDLDIMMAHRLVDYVYGRPKGEIAQELGGLGVTLLTLAQAAGFSAEKCEREEVERVLQKPTSHFAQRNALKNAAGLKVVP